MAYVEVETQNEYTEKMIRWDKEGTVLEGNG